MYVHYFVLISPWKRGGVLYLNKLEFPSPKDALCQAWLKLAQWFWRRRYFNFVNLFSLFHNCFPLEKDGTLHLSIREFPLPKDAFCKVWFKLAQWFCSRRRKCAYFTTTTTATTFTTTTMTNNEQILIRKLT